ncbi:hypothetical protein K5X82_07420 [Halosquirtibacter xylanolyticus]|uniref:hypothetical protein n=1 Tax=Halosquirtibacter xylanolyticus TaxID=3374599 RepID=UPI003748D6EC|nr:hypothetical protein K5X82_07420 [Prolixibacteraceae bacterium]
MNKIQDIKIQDLAGNDLRKAIIKENSLQPDFIEKHLGNYVYTQGSADVYEIGSKIYNNEAFELEESQKEEFFKLINKCFDGFPPIVPRSIISSLEA